MTDYPLPDGVERVDVPEGDAGVEYRTIPQYPNYAVGSDGIVWSRFNNRWGTGTWRKRKTPVGRHGYPVISLSRRTESGSEQRAFTLHCIVLHSFAGPPAEHLECRHLDGNKLNNAISNLAWGTSSENKLDIMRHGKRTGTRGERHPKAKLTTAAVIHIREACGCGAARAELASQYGVSRITIESVTARRTWRHV